MSLRDCGIFFYFIEMILVYPAGIPNKQWQWMLWQKYGGKGNLVNPRETHYRVHRKGEGERCKNGRKGMWSALQRNIMHASIWRKRALKNPSVCGKAPSAGEHCPYPAAEKSLEQMKQCRAGDWESAWPKLYFRFVNLMVVLFPPFLQSVFYTTLASVRNSWLRAEGSSQ